MHFNNLCHINHRPTIQCRYCLIINMFTTILQIMSQLLQLCIFQLSEMARLRFRHRGRTCSRWLPAPHPGHGFGDRAQSDY